MTLLGCIIELDAMTNTLGSETGEPCQIIFIDRIG